MYKAFLFALLLKRTDIDGRPGEESVRVNREEGTEGELTKRSKQCMRHNELHC